MRYVLSVVFVGMFVLVACQRPIIQPVPHPQPVGPVTDPLTTVLPSGLTAAPAFNPSNLTIEMTGPTEGARLTQLETDVSGVPRYQLELITDALTPWVVQASGTKSDGKSPLTHRDIIMDSFPDYRGRVTTVDRSTGDFEKHLYQFFQPYKENQIIEPMDITIVARDTSYCERIFEYYADGKEVEAVNGIMPDKPESKRDCGKIVATSLYNFDQKVRLRLRVGNVKAPKTSKQLAMEKIICRMFNAAKDALVRKATHTYASGNDWSDILKELTINLFAELVAYKISTSDLACHLPEYQHSLQKRGYKNSNTAGGETGQPHGP